MGQNTTQNVHDEWVSFPGGELEGRRPKTGCPACREAFERIAGRSHDPAATNVQFSQGDVSEVSAARARLLCFQCYREELARERVLKSATNLETASTERFQTVLPFEPVNRGRLERLKADRSAARRTSRAGMGRFVHKRRHAQIDARHALQRLAAGLQARQVQRPEYHGVFVDAARAANLELPASWRPFVRSVRL